MSTACLVPPLYPADRHWVETLTAELVIVKTGEAVAPAATVTDAGTAATAGLLLVSVTTPPPTGAAAFRVTRLPVAESASPDGCRRKRQSR